jgi:hypothetical protein
MSNSVIRDLFGYEFSNDYEQLWGLAQRQSVACVVDFELAAEVGFVPDRLLIDEIDSCRDICQTIKTPDALTVGVRGCTYIAASTLEYFVTQCKRCKLEWIVPFGIIPAAAAFAADATP